VVEIGWKGKEKRRDGVGSVGGKVREVVDNVCASE
jgi:hypothetical protein